MLYLGRQIIAELFGCEVEALSDLEFVKRTMLESASRARATVIEAKFHRFAPHGISGVVIVAESHLAIHTWPEHMYAAVDIFTCGNNTKPIAALRYISKALGSKKVKYKELKRGKREDVVLGRDMVLNG